MTVRRHVSEYESEWRHKALAELSDDQREVLQLSCFDDQTHTQISQTLGIPLGTVKSRIRLAFGRSRNLLEDEE